MNITTIEAKSLLGKHGYRPVIYVYENDKFLWRQTEPIWFVNDSDAMEYAGRMKNELLVQWIKNNTQEVA